MTFYMHVIFLFFSFVMQWVYNILDGKAEKDRVIYQDPDPEIGFVLLPDFKWDQSELENLHMIAIARRRGIYSVRELRLEHVSMLRNILTRGKVCSLFHTCDLPIREQLLNSSFSY